MSQTGRDIEEKNTKNQAQRLGFSYLDTRTLKQRPLYKDIIDPAEILDKRLIPIVSDSRNITFGITSQTSPQVVNEFTTKHNQQRVNCVLISNSALKEYYRLYNPEKKIVYRDINLGSDNSIEQFKNVSQIVLSVKNQRHVRLYYPTSSQAQSF